jgi:adenylyltransferase/sulfurtransferase
MLNPASERYARHVALPDIGTAGQQRLFGASALVIGAGGLGSAALMQLAAAGIGRLIVQDADEVAPTNLNRQFLYGPRDVGQPKARSAVGRLAQFNPDLCLEARPRRFVPASAADDLAGVGVVLDCTDTYAAGFAIADACREHRIPVVSGGVAEWYGQVMVVRPAEGCPCLRCLFEHPPPEVASPPILGAVAGVVGAMQAAEAVKVLLNLPGVLDRHLLSYDALAARCVRIERQSRPGCTCCGA